MDQVKTAVTSIRRNSMELLIQGQAHFEKLTNTAMRYEEIIARSLFIEVNEYPPEDEEADIETGKTNGPRVLL
jgi:hypothetical protein